VGYGGSGVVMETASVVVKIQRRDDGAMLTEHRPLGDEDAITLMQWPTYGQAHLALALITEAVRRESRVSALVSQSTTNTIPDAESLKNRVRQQLLQGIERCLDFAVQEVLKDLTPSEAESTL
jgi:hypothetical protein